MLVEYQKLYVAKKDIDDDPNYRGYPGADEDRAKIYADALEYLAKAQALSNQLLAEGVSSNEVGIAIQEGWRKGQSMM